MVPLSSKLAGEILELDRCSRIEFGVILNLCSFESYLKLLYMTESIDEVIKYNFITSFD